MVDVCHLSKTLQCRGNEGFPSYMWSSVIFCNSEIFQNVSLLFYFFQWRSMWKSLVTWRKKAEYKNGGTVLWTIERKSWNWVFRVICCCRMRSTAEIWAIETIQRNSSFFLQDEGLSFFLTKWGVGCFEIGERGKHLLSNDKPVEKGIFLTKGKARSAAWWLRLSRKSVGFLMLRNRCRKTLVKPC